MAALLVVVLAITAERALELLDSPGLAGGTYDAGNAKYWILGTGAGLAAFVLAAILVPPRWIGRLILLPVLLTATLLLATATLGGRALDMAAAVLTLSACYAAGRVVARALGARALAELVPVATIVGAGVLGAVLFLAGNAGALHAWIVVPPVLALGLLGVVWLGAAAMRNRDAIVTEVRAGPLSASAVAVLSAVFGWIVVYVAAPEVTYDSLYAKEWLPEHWAAIHEIDTMFRHPVMGVTGLAQVLAIPGHLVGGDAVGRYMQVCMLATIVGTTWWFGRARGAAGPLAAVCVAAVPAVIWQATTANDDLLLGLAAISVALVIVSGPLRPQSEFRTAMIVGVLAGTGVLLKLHLVPLIGAMALVWMLSGGTRSLLPRLAGLALGSLVIAGPVIGLRWIEYDNPVFPMYNAIFRSSHYPPVNETFNLPYWVDAGLLDAIKTPWLAVWQPDVANEMAPPGMFGVLVVAVASLLLLGWRRVGGGRREAIALWIAGGATLVAWWLSTRYFRYLLPLGFVAVLGTLIVASPATLTRRQAGFASVLAIVTATLALPAFVPISYMIPGRTPPVAAALGRWDEDDYLRRAFAERDVLMAFNRLAPPGAMAVSAAHQRTWLTGNRDLTPGWELIKSMEMRGGAPDAPASLRRMLSELGVDWIILGPNDPVSESLLRAGTTPVFANNGWTLFRIGPPEAGRPLGCDPELTGKAGCWAGAAFDDTPGLTAAEAGGGAVQRVATCPGTTLAVTLDADPSGAPAVAVLVAEGGDPKAGSAAVTVQPGGTGTSHLTVPDGSDSVRVHLHPGQQGGIGMASIRAFGPSCNREQSGSEHG